eukprot:9636780-Karenia_brevis.AAC.1
MDLDLGMDMDLDLYLDLAIDMDIWILDMDMYMDMNIWILTLKNQMWCEKIQILASKIAYFAYQKFRFGRRKT